MTESTYGHIEGNTIMKNFKANIALGGPKASDCVILNNQISSSRAEGIFLIEVGFCWLIRNRITDNADGIVMFDSNPNIESNQINNNMRSGISCMGSSFPKINGNAIFGNHQSGINFRDSSTGSLSSNKIFKNFYQLSTYNLNKSKIKQILEENPGIVGDNEFTNFCIIF